LLKAKKMARIRPDQNAKTKKGGIIPKRNKGEIK